MLACLKRFGPELYDRAAAPLSLKVRMLKAEVIETLAVRVYDVDPLGGTLLPSFERLTTKSSCKS